MGKKKIEKFPSYEENMDDVEEFEDKALEEESEDEGGEEQDEAEDTPAGKIKKGFLWWFIGDKSYRLKLSSTATLELEQKYRKNLMSIIGASDGGMPPLSTMLDITHAAMKEWNHGIKKEAVIKLYDKYLALGGSQLNFYTDIYMKIFVVSNFFPKSVANELGDSLTQASAELN